MVTPTRRVLSAFVSVTAVCAAAVLAGCASSQPEPVQLAVDDPRLGDAPTEPRPDPSAIAAEEDALAAQAARDVEAFLQARAEAVDTPPTPAPPAEEDPEPAEPPAINWTDPAWAIATSSHGVEFDDATAQPTLAREESALPPVSLDLAPALEHGPPTLEPDALEQLLLETRRQLYAVSRESDMPLREMLLVAAMSMVSDDTVLDEDAIHAINDLTEEEKTILRQLQAFFQQLGTRLDGSQDAQEVVTEAVGGLRTSLVEMRLALGAAALCRRVVGFGDIEEFTRNDQDRYAFLAHTERQVIVYLEVDDFTSELNEQGDWVTELSQQLTIYSDRDGIPVWKADWQTAVDRSKNRRRDFFTVQVVSLPKALSVGRYQLKIRVRDERSGAETEGGLEFEMVADEKMAGGSY